MRSLFFELGVPSVHQVRVWNGDATVTMADGHTTHGVCESDVTCSALKVSDTHDLT